MANNSAGEQSRADIKMIQINVHVDGLGSASCRVVVVRPAGRGRFVFVRALVEEEQNCAKRATRHVDFKDDPNQFNVDVERE